MDPRNVDPVPHLSVIIPAHDEAELIGQQLGALADQEWPGRTWEVIVVDNASADHTVEIAEGFRGRIPQLRVVSANDGTGPAYARNVGARAARAGLLSFCDADDVVAPGWLGAIGRSLEHHGLVTGVLAVDHLNPRWLADSRGRTAGGRPIVFQGLFQVAASGNLGVSRTIWDSIGGFRENLPGAEDIHFSMEAWRRGVEAFVEPGAVVHYRYRQSAGALWRQGRSYGKGRAEVCRDLRRHGFRPSRFSGWKSWLWLVVNLPKVRTPQGRMIWVWVAGNRVGQVEGSIRNRSLYI